MTHVTILRKAALALRKHGLAAYTRKDNQGAMCALGVLGFVLYKDTWTYRTDAHPIIPRLEKALGLRTDNLAGSALADWSNGADEDTVVGAFRRVARQWSKRGR